MTQDCLVVASSSIGRVVCSASLPPAHQNRRASFLRIHSLRPAIALKGRLTQSARGNGMLRSPVIPFPVRSASGPRQPGQHTFSLTFESRPERSKIPTLESLDEESGFSDGHATSSESKASKTRGKNLIPVEIYLPHGKTKTLYQVNSMMFLEVSNGQEEEEGS